MGPTKNLRCINNSGLAVVGAADTPANTLYTTARPLACSGRALLSDCLGHMYQVHRSHSEVVLSCNGLRMSPARMGVMWRGFRIVIS